MRWSLATVALLPRGVTAHAAAAEQRAVIEWAAGSGFEGLEVSGQWLNIDDLPPPELDRFVRDVRNSGLTISGINVNRCLFTRGSGAKEALQRIRRAVDVAGRLGTHLLTLSLSLPLSGRPRSPLRGSEFPAEERAAALRQASA